MRKIFLLLFLAVALISKAQVAPTCPYMISCSDTLSAGTTSDSLHAVINVPYTVSLWSVKTGTPGVVSAPNSLNTIITGLQTGKTTVIYFNWSGPSGSYSGTTTITVMPATIPRTILKVVQTTVIYYSDSTTSTSTQTYQ